MLRFNAKTHKRFQKHVHLWDNTDILGAMLNKSIFKLKTFKLLNHIIWAYCWYSMVRFQKSLPTLNSSRKAVRISEVQVILILKIHCIDNEYCNRKFTVLTMNTATAMTKYYKYYSVFCTEKKSFNLLKNIKDSA